MPEIDQKYFQFWWNSNVQHGEKKKFNTTLTSICFIGTLTNINSSTEDALFNPLTQNFPYKLSKIKNTYFGNSFICDKKSNQNIWSPNYNLAKGQFNQKRERNGTKFQK